MQFTGLIQDIPVRILVDSGSTTSFLSQQIADQIPSLVRQPSSHKIQIANGGIMHCSEIAVDCRWSMASHVFIHSLKLLPLQSYDLILGIDWLEQYSPMKVDWKDKWMQIPFGNTSIVLHGFPEMQNRDLVFQLLSLHATEQLSAEPPAYTHEIQQILSQFPDVCSPPSELPPVRPYDHSIPLIQGARPVNIRSYRYPPMLKDEIEHQVTQMLQQGIIQPSNSPFSSPVLLVKKKDGSWRFCVDYRYLNDLTVKGTFPIPVFEQLMDELSNAKWFSILDLFAGYHQVRLKEGEEHKTAFSTHSGHFEFKVMAFGLTGAPNTFQQAMNITLASLLRKCVIVFFDDILVFSPTDEQHLEDLKKVFHLLQSENWHIKLSKCRFAQQQISYLGHIISSAGIATDPSKVEAIVTWPVPTNVREVRGFLGLAGFYRKFIRHFAIIAKPLTNLLKKGSLFIWTSEHQLAFDTLKQSMSSAPVLSIPDFTLPFAIETDASNNGIGAVLLQQGHPLAFISKPLGPRTQGLSTYEKEYMAILFAVEQWRVYLQLAEFIIYTDQKSLVHLNEQRLHTMWQQKVFTKLLGLHYRIVYKKGSDNRVADALSRRPHSSEESCLTMSAVVPQWCDDVIAGYASDPQAQTYIQQLVLSSDSVPHFSYQHGLLRYKNRIWLGTNKELQLKVMQALHASALGGHSGSPVTYRRVRHLFAWKSLKHDVHQFVTSCPTCQQAKPDRARYPGLLQPLQTPSSAWQSISMDFVEGLPPSQGYNCIMVVVDRFSKYSHFIALKHSFTALTVAKTFLQQVYRLHGLPSSIVSDRDRIFISQLWQELFRLADVQLKMSSAYHPQTDGQTERVNQCLETFLRCFVNAAPSKWYDWLHLAEFWYNSSCHSAIERSPFEALYGYAPRHFGIDALDACPSMELSTWLEDKHVMQTLIKQHLQRAQKRMKDQADKKRSERSFSKDDWVYLKLQPYVQSSLAPRSNQKLAFKFFGPFQVEARVGSVAYKLALPAHSQLHPVFHVSQLKQALPVKHGVSSLPVDSAVVLQGLIKWSGMPRSLATWEDLEALRHRFPRAPAWGQAGSKGGGDVTTAATSTEAGPSTAAHPASVARQSTRARRPNARVHGPEWA
jgi:hypothetical protein